jgi:hypothetical protein
MGECVFVVKTYYRLYAIKTGISSEGKWGYAGVPKGV